MTQDPDQEQNIEQGDLIRYWNPGLDQIQKCLAHACVAIALRQELHRLLFRMHREPLLRPHMVEANRSRATIKWWPTNDRRPDSSQYVALTVVGTATGLYVIQDPDHTWFEVQQGGDDLLHWIPIIVDRVSHPDLMDKPHLLGTT